MATYQHLFIDCFLQVNKKQKTKCEYSLLRKLYNHQRRATRFFSLVYTSIHKQASNKQDRLYTSLLTLPLPVYL